MESRSPIGLEAIENRLDQLKPPGERQSTSLPTLKSGSDFINQRTAKNESLEGPSEVFNGEAALFDTKSLTDRGFTSAGPVKGKLDLLKG